MKLAELMKDVTPNPKYTGDVTADDMVLAIDLTPTGAVATKESEYAVVQMNIAGLDASLNPVTSEKTYIRAGKSTQKTGPLLSIMMVPETVAIQQALILSFVRSEISQKNIPGQQESKE